MSLQETAEDQIEILSKRLLYKDIPVVSKFCPGCAKDFTAHSFNFVCHTLEGGHVFYTKISNASQYDDTEGIINHCSNYLHHVDPPKWSWIIDFAGFGIKHTLGIHTGIRLSKLINQFGRFQNLIVININPLVRQMLKLVKLTLNKEYHECIHIITPNDTFANQIQEWQALDNNKELLMLLILGYNI